MFGSCTLATLAYEVAILVVLTIFDANAPTKMFLTTSGSVTSYRNDSCLGCRAPPTEDAPLTATEVLFHLRRKPEPET